ncbi:MAG: hypothetical protein ABF325_04425 [Lentimonas sp.]
MDYLVTFESPDGSNRQLVAVGPDLEYTDFDEVSRMQIDDMRATTVRRLPDPKVAPKKRA